MSTLAEAPPLYKTGTAPQNVAVLLLVDNNRFTQSVWPDLSDLCLPSFFNELSATYTSVPITTIVLESNPTYDQNSTHALIPRQYHAYQDAVRDVRFNEGSTNRLTISLIHKGVELLAATNAVARHAIILAGSHPTESPQDNSSSTMSWNLLAQSFAKAKIYCHLMLPTNADRSSVLNNLFDEILRLQDLVERLWFINDRCRIVPRLSSVRGRVPGPKVNPSPQGTPLLSSPAHYDYNALRKGPVGNGTPLPAQAQPLPPPPQEPVPTLVAQLQQVHGLTKKKVYGTKPVRKPFVSGEVFREHSRKSVSLSPVSPSETSHGGRVTSPSITDRWTRVYHNGPIISPPAHNNLVRSHSHSDLGSSTSTFDHEALSSYQPPSATVSSPTSPISIHSPAYWSNAAGISPTWKLHQQSISETYNGENPAKAWLPQMGLSGTEVFTSEPPSQQSHEDLRMMIPEPNHALPERTIPRSIYRDELLSHLESPSLVRSTPTQFLSKHLPAASLAPASQTAAASYSSSSNYDSYHPVASWQAQPGTSTIQINTAPQIGVADTIHDPAHTPHPSPVSSSSSSLTGWAG